VRVLQLLQESDGLRRQLQRNGMRVDFSWRSGAQRYCELYRTLVVTA
jgi:glycogen synthase